HQDGAAAEAPGELAARRLGSIDDGERAPEQHAPLVQPPFIHDANLRSSTSSSRASRSTLRARRPGLDQPAISSSKPRIISGGESSSRRRRWGRALAEALPVRNARTSSVSVIGVRNPVFAALVASATGSRTGRRAAGVTSSLIPTACAIASTLAM